MASEFSRQGRQGLALAGLIGSAWLLSLVISLTLPLNQISPLLLGSVILIRAFLQTGLFIVAHDAMHNSLVPEAPRLNRLIGRTCLFLYAGLSYRLCCKNHHRHHQAPESSQDPDYQPSTSDSIVSWYMHFLGNYLGWKQLLNLAGFWFVLFNLTRQYQPDQGLQLDFVLRSAIVSQFMPTVSGGHLDATQKGCVVTTGCHLTQSGSQSCLVFRSLLPLWLSL